MIDLVDRDLMVPRELVNESANKFDDDFWQAKGEFLGKYI